MLLVRLLAVVSWLTFQLLTDHFISLGDDDSICSKKGFCGFRTISFLSSLLLVQHGADSVVEGIVSTKVFIQRL